MSVLAIVHIDADYAYHTDCSYSLKSQPFRPDVHAEAVVSPVPPAGPCLPLPASPPILPLPPLKCRFIAPLGPPAWP